MNCKNCGHKIEKHIKAGNSFYCIDNHKDYGRKLACGCTKPKTENQVEKNE